MNVFTALVLIAGLAGTAITSAPSFAQSTATPYLVSSTPMTLAPPGATAYRIKYRSLSGKGQAIEVTGVVIIPLTPAPAQGRPMVAWAHGTFGVAEGCAPSMNPSMFATVAGLTKMIALGYAVVATDYAGLGTPGPHPYLIGVDSAHAVLDSVKAARELPQSALGRQYVVWGESQGGHAARQLVDPLRHCAVDDSESGRTGHGHSTGAQLCVYRTGGIAHQNRLVALDTFNGERRYQSVKAVG